MVQNKKQAQSGKKSMSQDFDKKSQSSTSDRTSDRSDSASRPGNMKQNDSKDKSPMSSNKKDIGSRK